MITESEKKRLQSLKEKRQAFKAKVQLVQQALSNLDNTNKNKKIIFDENIDEQESQKLKKKKDLFDSDDNNDNNNEQNSLWNNNDFSIKKSKNKKILGNDTRFTLDDRFVENDQTEETELIEDTNEYNLRKEKEKQLDILGNILGAPVMIKNQETKQETKSAKKGLMIRYDPTENEHCEYEMKSIQSESKEKKKKKKRDKPMPEIEEPAQVKVSKDIYYAVSDVLTESLSRKEEFSLLKAYGKGKDNKEDSKDCDASIVENNKAKRFSFNFSANSAFKYNSSDNEDINEAPDIDKQMVDETKDNIGTFNLFGHKDTLFFSNEDTRFNEAVRFFNTEAILNNNEFKNLRRELKMIVRKKIRRNEKKNQPWGKKRKINRGFRKEK